jgi:imidazolonepropionase-like amidohydrolase
MRKTAKAFAAALCMAFSFVISSAFAAAEEPATGVLVIRGGTINTITKGVIHDGSVLVKDGKILKIGKNIPVPKDAAVIEANGRWVMPGFVAVSTGALGIFRLSEEDKAPSLFDYLDPFSESLTVCLATGITTFSPNLGYDPYGRSRKNYSFANAILKPTYGSLQGMLIKEPAVLFINMAGLSPSEKDELRGFFRRAADYIAQETGANTKAPKEVKAPALPPDIKHYVAVLKKEIPVQFRADSREDILKAVAFVDEFGVRAQIMGAVEGWMVADELGRRNISTIIQPDSLMNGDPYRKPSGGSNIRNAVLQREKGVEFALLTSSNSMDMSGQIGDDLKTFPLSGAYAVRGGLDEKDALASLTIVPARMLGIDQRVGSLEEGKDADIIVLDGDPLDYRTYVDYTILNGKILYDKSKSVLYKRIPKPKRIF